MTDLLGILHPALVHMPIGFVLLTIFYEWYFGRSSVILWMITMLSAVISAASGLILINTGYYEGLEVFLHLVSGISIAVLTALLFFFKWREWTFFNGQSTILKSLLLTVLVTGGHLGGAITHGHDYLPFLNFGSEDKKMSFSSIEMDSINIYGDLIAPILDTKCIRCHEDGDARGQLNMSTQKGLLSTVYGDPAVAPGNLVESQIFKRISLDPSHKKYMPPSGPDLSYAEKRLIEWWIRSGATFDKSITEALPPDDIQRLLEHEYNLNFKEQSFYEKSEVTPISSEVMEQIISAGFNVDPLAAGINFLSIDIKGKDPELSEDRLSTLLLAVEQITWLDLSDSDLGDNEMKILSNFINLTKLKLQKTAISDIGLKALEDLNHLEVLNLYGASISDESVVVFKSLPSLKKLYLWQTTVTPEGVSRLTNSNSELEIVLGQ